MKIEPPPEDKSGGTLSEQLDLLQTSQMLMPAPTGTPGPTRSPVRMPIHLSEELVQQATSVLGKRRRASSSRLVEVDIYVRLGEAIDGFKRAKRQMQRAENELLNAADGLPIKVELEEIEAGVSSME